MDRPFDRQWAFHRHSRPQLPAGVAREPQKRLTVKSTPSWLPKSSVEEEPQVVSIKKSRMRVFPRWNDHKKLGALIQGNAQYIVAQDRAMRLMMFRLLDWQSSSSLAQRLQHDNLLVAQCLIQDTTGTYIGFEYTRFTLEELLNTHLQFDEEQIRFISKSVFDALSYLHKMNLCHSNISPSTVRVRSQPITVVLADCESCMTSTATRIKKDTDDFGLLLLDCMAQPVKRGVATAFEVRQKRADNQFFGLSNGERWSATQELVDFVDSVFEEDSSALTKFLYRHNFLQKGTATPDVLTPLLEIASLECITLWRPNLSQDS